MLGLWFLTENPPEIYYKCDYLFMYLCFLSFSQVVLNHETYILDLVEANKGNVQWKFEYNAKVWQPWCTCIQWKLINMAIIGPYKFDRINRIAILTG